MCVAGLKVLYILVIGPPGWKTCSGPLLMKVAIPQSKYALLQKSTYKIGLYMPYQ